MILLLFGKERFLKDEALADLKAKLFRNPSELNLNFQSFDAEEHGVSPTLGFLSTAPFLAEKRLAVLWGIERLSDGDAGRLVSALGSLPSSACFVLETEETNTKKNETVRLAAEKAQAVACHTPFERDMPGWAELRARKIGLTLERGAASYLVSRMGDDLASLARTLGDLALYVHPRKSVTAADVAALAPSNPEEDVFKLAELLLDEKKKEALTILDGLYRSGTRAPEIVAALGGQIERYKKASSLLASGRSAADVGEEMRVPRVFQGAFFQRIKKTPLQKLVKLQKALLECDESFKTGRAEERISVERFVLLT